MDFWCLLCATTILMNKLMFQCCFYNKRNLAFLLTKKTKTDIAFKLQNLYLNSLGTYHEDLVIGKLFFSKFGKKSPVKKSLLLPFACKPFSQSNRKCFIVRKACSPCPPLICSHLRAVGPKTRGGLRRRLSQKITAPHHKYVSKTGSCQLKFFQLPNQKNCHTKSAREAITKWESAYCFPTSTYNSHTCF